MNTFSKKETPEEEDILKLKPVNYDIVAVLMEAGFVMNSTGARREIAQGGVKVNGEVTNWHGYMVKPGDVVQKGKRFFVRVK